MIKLINPDYFNVMAHPVGRKVNSSTVPTRPDHFFYHLFAIYLKFNLGSGDFIGEYFAFFGWESLVFFKKIAS